MGYNDWYMGFNGNYMWSSGKSLSLLYLLLFSLKGEKGGGAKGVEQDLADDGFPSYTQEGSSSELSVWMIGLVLLLWYVNARNKSITCGLLPVC